MLWACLHFPDFSLQLWLRGAAQAGPVIVASGGNRPEVLSCNPPARGFGIAPGMTVSAAYALAPELIERPRDTSAESKALQRLAAWAGQFTPTISLAPPDCLLLEIGASLKLFGGLRTLLLQVGAGLTDLGYTASLAAAPTPSAARLLARTGIGAAVTGESELPQALSGLPLALLDRPADTLHALALMGVRTIGECLQLPRDGLARRFGQESLDELDRALGKLPDARKLFVPPTRYRAALALPAPVQEVEPLLFAAKRLVLELAGFLAMKQAGVTRLGLELRHEERKPTTVTLGFSRPSRDAQRILALLRERLSRLELAERVESIVLTAGETRPLGSRNLSLFPEDRVDDEDLWLIIDHLRARLGAQAVHGIATCPDHRPELAWRAAEPGAAEGAGYAAARPLWLLDTPRPLQVENEVPVCGGPLSLLAGPERIENGWWDGRDLRRDYFLACNGQGLRFWIFQDRAACSGWFLHGIFA